MTTHTPLISFSLHCVVSMHRRPCRHRPLPSPAAIARCHRPPPSAAAIGRHHCSSPIALTAAHRPRCRPRCRPRWLSSLSPSLFPSPIARHSRSRPSPLPVSLAHCLPVAQLFSPLNLVKRHQQRCHNFLTVTFFNWIIAIDG